MEREDWISLLKKVPDTLLDQVVLSLSTGIDVYTQRLLQFGDEALLLRGRLGGTDEAERIFMVPWTEIRMMFFSRPVEDQSLFNIFGDLLGGVRKSMVQAKKEDEDHDDERRPAPVRLPAPTATESPRPNVDVSHIRDRLLQPRKQPPRTETNKPMGDRPINPKR
jgi:hypothetical protein